VYNSRQTMTQNPISRILITLGDITKINVDAVVNAANESLLGGLGVDDSIHSAAGPGLLKECEILHGCETGNAKITGGYNLPARNVIHAVGPMYVKSAKHNKELLASTYRRSLEVARENNLNTIAFPSISTGYFGYPIDEAIPVVFDTVLEYLKKDQDMIVVFVMLTEENFKLYNDHLDKLLLNYRN